jgi:N-acetylmuramic acid 6-phosphate etherase
VMSKLIEYESDLYKKGENISYLTSSYYAISILTDTTERSPTFSLNAFENIKDEKINPSWCNMVLLEEKPIKYENND